MKEELKFNYMHVLFIVGKNIIIIAYEPIVISLENICLIGEISGNSIKILIKISRGVLAQHDRGCFDKFWSISKINILKIFQNINKIYSF